MKEIDTTAHRWRSGTTELATYDTGPRPVIAIGIPSFGMVHLAYCARLLELRKPLHRTTWTFYVVGKEVGDARNEIVSKALAIGHDDPSVRCSHVLFLDDDVLFHRDALLQLLSRKRPIISGLYYAKCPVLTPLIFSGNCEGTAEEWSPGDVVECEGHGMGLTLIETEVFVRIQEAFNLGTDQCGYPAWFQTKWHEVVRVSGGDVALTHRTEDIVFLERAKALGYRPAVDTSAAAFGWHLDTKRMVVYPEAKWKEFLATGTVTWETSNGPVLWDLRA